MAKWCFARGKTYNKNEADVRAANVLPGDAQGAKNSRVPVWAETGRNPAHDPIDQQIDVGAASWICAHPNAIHTLMGSDTR